MKKQLAILGLIFFLALSGRAYQVDLYDTYLGYKYCIDSRYCVSYGNNLVFLNMACYGGSRWDIYSGSGLLFFDLVYNNMKIVIFYDAPSYESVVIESFWTEIGIGKEAYGYLGVGSFGMSGTLLWFGDVRNIEPVQQELENPTPLAVKWAGGDGAVQNCLSIGDLKNESDPPAVAPEGGAKGSYLCRLRGDINDDYYYIFYVYDYPVSLGSGVIAYPIIARVYSHSYIGWEDGLIFIKSQSNGYLVFSLILFDNGSGFSISFTDDWFNLSTANEMPLISPWGNDQTVDVYLY